MANSVQLQTLRTMARRRADMENSSFVTDAELNDYINSAIRSVYDILVAAGESYYVTSDTISTDGATKSYSLPATFYKLKGIDYTYQGQTTTMQPFTFNDRNDYQLGTSIIRYLLLGSNIRFEPTPPAQNMTIWFIPAFQDLSGDTDTFDGVNGWEEYATLQAAIYMRNKEEGDIQGLLLERDRELRRIKDMVYNRDQGLNEVVSDVSEWGDLSRYYYGER